MTKKRPGVMLYFRWRSALRLLTTEQLGVLFLAILDYGDTGEEPQFDDKFLAFAWSTIRLHIDDDEERYEQVVQKRREAANKRWSDTPALPAAAATPAQPQQEASRQPPRPAASRAAKSTAITPAYADPNVMNRYF